MKSKIMLGAYFKKFLKVTINYLCIGSAYFISFMSKLKNRTPYINIGFIVEEFFHHDLRGFGGFGKTVKNISDYFNSDENNLKIKVLLSQGLPIASALSIRRFHNADTFLRPLGEKHSFLSFVKRAILINSMGIKLFITIDCYPTYGYYLFASPYIPVIVWIKDPRSREEWEKISVLSLELKQRKRESRNDLIRLADEKACSIKKILELSKILKRKVIFVTQANSLIERARRCYKINQLNPYLLLNPIQFPSLKKITYSERPSLCFLGRLDPIKRPWIFFELAKRFTNIDFYVGGITHVPDLIGPIVKKYSAIKNLNFLGHVDGKEKDNLLANCWAIVNTSIHEALPVSFLEAFSFGKCIISCQNPDRLTERFGYYTGEVLGEGFGGSAIDIFSKTIETFISDKEEMMEKGRLAKMYVEENHSFANFENKLKEILSSEKII